MEFPSDLKENAFERSAGSWRLLRMKVRVFLEVNVFIYAFEFPHSNSRKIIELLNEAEVEAITSEQVLGGSPKLFSKIL